MSHFVVDAIKSDTRYVGSSRRTRAIFGIAWRESRTARRRLLLYMSSISLGVAALVAIDSFSDNVIRSVHEQSRALLGGDVQVERNAPRTKAVDSLLDSLSKAGIVHTTATDFTSMALVPRSGGTRLVQVHAIAKGYPYYGNIITTRTYQDRLDTLRQYYLDHETDLAEKPATGRDPRSGRRRRRRGPARPRRRRRGTPGGVGRA